MAKQVFVCYAREDQDFVLELAGALKKEGVPVWLDQWDIPGGADWAMEVEEALYRSSHLIVVLSPASRASEDVRSEWVGAVNAGIPVIPVLFQECRIPLRLGLLQHIDFCSRSPTDAVAVGEIVRALGIEESTREEYTPPLDLEEVSGGIRSGETTEQLLFPDGIDDGVALYGKPKGAMIRAARQRRGLSQRELAEMLGRSASWLSRRESGTGDLNIWDAEKMADILGLEVSDVIE